MVISAGFPRVRGDVPAKPIITLRDGRFSPRARGCSLDFGNSTLAPSVFPACAGMFRTSWGTRLAKAGFPRVRGDVPLLIGRCGRSRQFSPRARGCS